MSSAPGPLDDAAVVHPEGAERDMVLTLDVITPLVDDPETFGRIAAANALSDVYAMGGRPEVALSFVGIPDGVGLDVLEQILHGVADKAREAECGIVGGHSIRDSEPKVGLAVVGSVARDGAWTHRQATAGQKLVLTKALGTGVLAQALRAGAARAEDMEHAVRSMQALNARACAAGLGRGVTAATDVTGYGLLGHLWHMVSASGVAARLDAARVPLLPGALEAAGAGHVPGGSKRNLSYVKAQLRGEESLPPALLTVLADAQTSGGLLLCVPAAQADALVTELGAPAVVIGEIVADEPKTISLG